MALKPVKTAKVSAPYRKRSLAVRPVRLHSPLRKLIENFGVLIVSKYYGVFLG